VAGHPKVKAGLKLFEGKDKEKVGKHRHREIIAKRARLPHPADKKIKTPKRGTREPPGGANAQQSLWGKEVNKIKISESGK